MNYIGTSGFTYQNWAAAFYPDGLPQTQWLEFYAQQFNSVEINNSFYRLPQANTFAQWQERTPPHFSFAIKGSRYITHQKRLKQPEPHIKRFFNRAEKLGDKLGVVLWQLADNLAFDPDKLARFCAGLPHQYRQALEVCHGSWFCEQAYDLLRRNNVALVIAQSDRWPYVDKVATADFVYVRFHGAPDLYASSYSAKQLSVWAHKLKHLASGRDIYAYFNNDAKVYAPANAKTFRALLDD